MTSSFRDIENDVDANFSEQQRRLFSEITSESVEALEALRHSLVHEAVAEIMRRGSRKEEVVSQ